MSNYTSRNYSSSKYIIYESITPLLIYNTSLRHFAESMHFPVTLNSLNKALENDEGKGLDHSYAPPSIFQENTISSSLSSLGSTSDPLPATSVL